MVFKKTKIMVRKIFFLIFAIFSDILIKICISFTIFLKNFKIFFQNSIIAKYNNIFQIIFISLIFTELKKFPKNALFTQNYTDHNFILYGKNINKELFFCYCKKIFKNFIHYKLYHTFFINLYFVNYKKRIIGYKL